MHSCYFSAQSFQNTPQCKCIALFARPLPYLALIEITCGVPEMLRAWAEKQKCKGFLSSPHQQLRDLLS